MYTFRTCVRTRLPTSLKDFRYRCSAAPQAWITFHQVTIPSDAVTFSSFLDTTIMQMFSLLLSLRKSFDNLANKWRSCYKSRWLSIPWTTMVGIAWCFSCALVVFARWYNMLATEFPIKHPCTRLVCKENLSPATSIKSTVVLGHNFRCSSERHTDWKK